MKTLRLSALSFLLWILSTVVIAQCPLATPYILNQPAQQYTCGTTVASSIFITTLGTCYYAGEYGSIVGTVPGNTYCFEAGPTDFLTLYDIDMTTVLASGTGEVCAMALSDTLIAQINLDPACNTVNSCRALRAICADCPAVPMGCTDPTAVNYNCALVDDGSCIAADPGNDCLTAIPIVPDGPTATCTVNSVNFLATNFSGTIPSCEFSTVLNDKWYSWNSGMISSLNFSAYDYGVHVAVYRNSCGSLTEVDCLGSSTGQLSGWTTNESLYIQVYNTYSYNSSSTFCLQENCDPLVEMTYTCTSDSTFDIVMDVLSMGGATSYGLSIADFSTVFITDTITSSGTYTYSNFPAGTGYTTDLIGLDVGACTYSSFYYANCFCFGAEPINDLCLDAVMLPVYPDSCIASTMGTIQCAIQYENDVSACNYYGYYYGNTSDVWYTFTAPASGSVTMDLLNLYGGTYYGLSYSILSGSCGSTYEEDCGGAFYPGINFTLTPGVTYLIRVFVATIPELNSTSSPPSSIAKSQQYGDFTICLWDTNPLSCVPTLSLSGNIPDADYIVGSTIFSDGIVLPGSDVYFEAGSFIELQSGFTADETFEVQIGGCN